MTRLLLVALATLVACEREERRFSVASAEPISATPQTTSYAGEPPIEGGAFDPALPGYRETAFDISQGQTLYTMMNCVGCHAHGGGGMGPALMDSYWRYGSAPAEIATTIIAGRPDGMPAFRGKLAATQLYQLVAYVRTIGGLVPKDAAPSRGEHIQAIPAPTLVDDGWPTPGRERP